VMSINFLKFKFPLKRSIKSFQVTNAFSCSPHQFIFKKIAAEHPNLDSHRQLWEKRNSFGSSSIHNSNSCLRTSHVLHVYFSFHLTEYYKVICCFLTVSQLLSLPWDLRFSSYLALKERVILLPSSRCFRNGKAWCVEIAAWVLS
jgi:hypothetical protein